MAARTVSKKKAAAKKKITKKQTAKRNKAGTSRGAAAERRALFVESYCTNGGNAKQAAISAGFSVHSAEVTGSKLLREPKVASEIKRRSTTMLKAAMEKSQLTADEVMMSLARDLRFDPARLYHGDGKPKKIHELDEDTRLALRGADIAADGTIRYKTPEKTAAREQGMKHFGLYEADNKQVTPLSVTINVVGKQPRT